MICPICRERYADFPEEDFVLTDHGYEPKTDSAIKKRNRVFESDKELICLDCNKEMVWEGGKQ